MVGTKAGGTKAAATSLAKYGKDFFKRNGSIGGKASRGGGFAGRPDLARAAGKIGGYKRVWTQEEKDRQKASYRKTMQKKRAAAEI